MAKKSVYCIATSQTQAENIVSQLKDSDFSNNDISVLFPDRTGTKDFAHEMHSKAPEGAASGAAIGGLIGGILGWLAGIGALAFPGLGAFVAAGPIMAALSGAAIGAALGGSAGALIGLGFPEYEAKRYGGKIREGNILISVHVDDLRQIDRVKLIFRDSGAQDISSSEEAEVAAAGRQ